MKVKKYLHKILFLDHCETMKGEEMSYINANDILPIELINEIQKYVQGVNLYIPRIPERKRTDSGYKHELYERNKEIYDLFQSGNKVSELAKMYYLSDKSIYRILGQMKK